ncbi:MAG: cytochrome c-type biosis protein CcmH [Actinomycetota bacterium]|nr:cytochrome c-type biosis protein CcmH [Actinomycetota bacterium]
MTRARALAPWLALAAVLVVAVAILLVRSQPDDSVAARTTRLAKQIKCPDCQGESIANSQTQIARSIRREIQQRVAHGQSDGTILAYYESRYPDALLRPDGGGIGVLAWGIPVVAIIGALGGIGLALRRWSRQPRLAASADDERLVERARAAEAP